MPDQELLSQLYLKLGGSEAPSDLVSQIHSVNVDQSLLIPSMFVLRIQDPEMRWVDSDLFRLGQEVEISARSLDREQAWLITGDITAIEPEYPEEGVPTVVVRGYDRLGRLARGTRSRTFVEVTDSDIVSRIANEYGLRAETGNTRTVHPHVYQDNVSDLTFLRERARLIGFILTAERNVLKFKPFRDAGTANVQLKYGSSLLSFRPCVTAAHQADSVVVRGWDYEKKDVVVSEQSPSGWPNAGAVSNENASGVLGEAQFVWAGGDVAAASFADSVAGGMKVAVEESKVQADGMALGNPAIRAGCTISVEAVGRRFSGDYFVTSALHTFETRGRYETHFGVTGLQTGTVRELLVDPGISGERSGRLLSEPVVGVVSNIEDPSNLGRVKVRFPWLSDSDETGWARVAGPMTGPDRGFFNLPEVDDEVLVVFVNGSFDHPVVVGGLWNGNDRPPNAASALSGGRVVQRLWKSRSGHLILLDDSDGSENIQIVDKSGQNKITIDTSGGEISLKSQQAVSIE
ncbi:MAG: VgrG-related protein, partial [Dehalococcoidia bacterium]